MGAMTFVSAGTVVTSSSGAAMAPVGSSVVSGNLLVLFTGQRGAGQSITSLATDWVQLATNVANGSLLLPGWNASAVRDVAFIPRSKISPGCFQVLVLPFCPHPREL